MHRFPVPFTPHRSGTGHAADLSNGNVNIESMGTQTILIVEDDQETRNLIARYLREHSFSVGLASNGREMDRVELLAGEPELVDTPSASGSGQLIARCPQCRVAVWSHYGGGGRLVAFVRVGTLDEPDHLPPDIHIFTASKQPWVALAPGVPAVPEYYDLKQYWPAESQARRAALKAAAAAALATNSAKNSATKAE